MDVVKGLFAPLPPLGSPVTTLGAFDGVHRGHQRILRTTAEWAHEAAVAPLVVTFDPLPKAVVSQGGALCITSLPHRLELLARYGIGVTVVLPFDAAIAAMPPEEFVRRVLLEWLRTRRIVFGRNSTFGRSGQGTLGLLRTLARQHGFEVRSPAPVRHHGQVISSTAIRQAIADGNLRAAQTMLGRPFSLLGTVVPGAARGRTLGFPTANLDLHHEAVPPDGVYATTATFDHVAHPALTYVGRRPTFEPHDAPPLVEVHLIDFQADLYGRDIEVRFIQQIRGDMRFPNADALVEQMHADRRTALGLCARAAAQQTHDLPPASAD